MRGYIWRGERSPCGATLTASAYRRPAVEGECAVYVVDSSPPDVLDWIVEWAPVIEMHHFIFDRGGGEAPPAGGSATEIICRNAIHAGIVEAEPSADRPRGRLRDLPAEAVCTVSVNGEVVGAQPLTELPGGPQGTVSWLRQRLDEAAAVGGEGSQGAAEADLLRAPGTIILASSPCSLYTVKAGDEVLVTCVGAEVRCRFD